MKMLHISTSLAAGDGRPTNGFLVGRASVPAIRA